MPAITPSQRDALGLRHTIYIDTEAEKSTGEVGGFLPQMGVSALGLFDYSSWRRLGGLQFATSPGDVAGVLSRRPGIWVGHNLVGYDLAVMAFAGYLDPLLSPADKSWLQGLFDEEKKNNDVGQRLRGRLAKAGIEIIDTQEIGRDAFEFRPKLDGFLEPLGMQKLDSGIDAPGMARRGEWGRLMTYLGGDVRGGTTVFEAFLGLDTLSYQGRDGVIQRPPTESWLRRRAELLKAPKAVQQGLF